MEHPALIWSWNIADFWGAFAQETRACKVRNETYI